MMIAIKKNDMDGKSVYVRPEADLADVPESHRGLVGQTERSVFADPARYFRDLAGKAKRLALRQWLKMLADCEKWILELHTASLPEVEPDALFRFFLDNGSSPGVRLRSVEAIPSLPRARGSL
jgi:hypothetical protein